eukprot:9559871-Alexandrium_andersonii.AAC.1
MANRNAVESVGRLRSKVPQESHEYQEHIRGQAGRRKTDHKQRGLRQSEFANPEGYGEVPPAGLPGPHP